MFVLVRRFIKDIPAWAFALLMLVVIVNIIYLVKMYQVRFIDAHYKFENGRCIISERSVWGPTQRAGLEAGDTILFIDSVPVNDLEQLYSILNNHSIGDTLTYKVSRKGMEFTTSRIIHSNMQEAPVLFYTRYLLMILFSCLSLFILYKKPRDRSVQIFYIFFQLYAVTHIACTLEFRDLASSAATVVFVFAMYLSGPALIHFTLNFPRRSSVYTKIKGLPALFYSIGFLIASFYSTVFLYYVYLPGSGASNLHNYFSRIHTLWILLTFMVALGIALAQYRTIKETFARNQLRIVISGAFLGYSLPIAYVFFWNFLFHMNFLYPFLFYDLAQEITVILMIICFLMAILRYRIWDIELFVKKALLYISATIVITTAYFLVIYIVNLLVENKTGAFRFFALAVSVIIFLVLRDWLQRLIDQFFHREVYDTATVVGNFEEKLAGVYRLDELKSGIVRSLDDIFHFKSFVLGIKKKDLTYELASAHGTWQKLVVNDYEVSPELESRLQKPVIFAPAELHQQISVPGMDTGELVVPLLNDNQPFGFILCGPKKSERTYSMQDIQVLSLVAKRLISMFNTANLYQKDLDRQLMLERERTRISQDMHDDVGASLTRISLMSDLVRNMPETKDAEKQWLTQISNSSHEVMEEMNQIIWALNPRNDNLEGLISYIRRFAFEYLEPTPVKLIFDLPEEIPGLVLSVEVRRNVYLVAREVIHNAVKHAEASKIWIYVEINKKGFSIRIKDNGKGFDVKKSHFQGNGLVNIHKRMNDIGGEMIIASTIGKGTECELKVHDFK